MRAVSNVFVVMVMVCTATSARAGDVNLTDKPEATWHAYVGKTVSISGSFVRFGKFGPAVTSGKGYLYIIQWPRDVAQPDDQEPILVESRLRYQPPTPIEGRRDPRPGFFYILHRECIIRVSVS